MTNPFVPRDQEHATALNDLQRDATVYLGPVSHRVSGVRPGWMLFEPSHPKVPLAEGFNTPQEAVAAVTRFLQPAGKLPVILWLPPLNFYAA